MLVLQNISYTHPNKEQLFDSIHLAINRDKVALIGNNGVGKSTLLQIIANELQPTGGHLERDTLPYYVPQIVGQFDHLSIAQALRIEGKLTALKEILANRVTEDNLNTLDDDWTIEERAHEALGKWQLSLPNLTQKLGTLSGGQKTKVFLAGIAIHQPELVLLDEPSNHLDTSGRQLLYEYISITKSALLVVSHDRKLLNLLNTVCELTPHGIMTYSGNYDFYAEQKQIENNAREHDILSKKKSLRKAMEKERETLERKQKLDARGKKKHEKEGVARIMMNTLKNKAENSTAKVKSVHAEKIDNMASELQELRASLPDIEKMKFGFDSSALHKGKVLFTARDINFSYGVQPLWKEALNMRITSGERIVLKGLNGAGKTTLIKLILGSLEPQEGSIYRADAKSFYIDQDYSLIDNTLKVYEQAQHFNTSAMLEHEIKIRLNRFLFTKDDWDKPCSNLSGGERMRLMLCCLIINGQSPDLIVLDEPTNNLDIQNIEILTAAINQYEGSLIVVSHDESFLEQINVGQSFTL